MEGVEKIGRIALQRRCDFTPIRKEKCAQQKPAAEKAPELNRLRLAFFPAAGDKNIYLTANQLLRLLLRMKIVKNGKSAIAADMSSTINCSIVLKPCNTINTAITATTIG